MQRSFDPRRDVERMTAVPRAALVLIALVAASCGGPSDRTGSGGEASSPSPAATAGYDGTWELVEGHAAEGPIEITERWRITLTIDGRKLGGLSACNYYGLSSEVDGAAISIEGIGGTDMGCHPQVVETEARYHAALLAAETITRTGDRLVIAGTDAELVFSLVPPLQTEELTNVRWELRSLIHGRGPGANASPAHPAHLYVGGDGRAEAFTGCRAFAGEWIEVDGMITFTRWGAKSIGDADCPEELTEQNDAIVGLGDGFTFDVEGRTLTVYGRFSATGLEFRASP